MWNAALIPFANGRVRHSVRVETVRRLTLFAQLIACVGISALLDFVSAHGEPVLCRYAPNPRLPGLVPGTFFCPDAIKIRRCGDCWLLLAANHHRAVLHVGAEHAAKRAACRAARVDILRDHVVAVGATCLARALVAFAP